MCNEPTLVLRRTITPRDRANDGGVGALNRVPKDLESEYEVNRRATSEAATFIITVEVILPTAK